MALSLNNIAFHKFNHTCLHSHHIWTHLEKMVLKRSYMVAKGVVVNFFHQMSLGIVQLLPNIICLCVMHRTHPFCQCWHTPCCRVKQHNQIWSKGGKIGHRGRAVYFQTLATVTDLQQIVRYTHLTHIRDSIPDCKTNSFLKRDK